MSKPAGVGSRTRTHTHTASAGTCFTAGINTLDPEYYPRREYLRVTVWRIGNNTRVNPPTIDGGSSVLSDMDGRARKMGEQLSRARK